MKLLDRNARIDINAKQNYTCPICEMENIRYDKECYICESHPIRGSSATHENYVNTTDSEITSMVFTLFVVFAPISFMLSNLFENPSNNFLAVFLLIPNFIMIMTSLISTIINNTNIGLIAGFRNVWILTFSVWAFYLNTHFIFHVFF